MLSWFLLASAVASNVAANVAFKLAMTSVKGDLSPMNLISVLRSGWFWVAIAACFMLLASYLLALRTIGLSASYAVVTSSAIVATCIASRLLFDEALTPVKLVGVSAIIIGLFCIVHDENAHSLVKRSAEVPRSVASDRGNSLTQPGEKPRA